MGFFVSSAQSNESAWDFTFDSLMHETPVALSDYDNNVLLVVNTASNCGFTGQYEGLEALYQTYKDKGLVVIGVPSNDFGSQEPGSHEEIAKFCKINYGVSFPMTAKYEVSGKNAHPFYKWARKELGFGTAPKWNFHKYLIGRDGKIVDYFNSTTKPQGSKIIKAVEAALDKKAG
ncbi:MAG: glutathione peroxidase [Rickettsiales bacterium]|nr:glutathione peroxidase [Rickettsiales bacterium]